MIRSLFEERICRNIYDESEISSVKNAKQIVLEQ
jgi:hypothetical protein